MSLRNNRPASFKEDTGDGLHGVGISKGVVSGPARILQELKDIGRVQHGDIRVVLVTAPGWTPVFLVISGLMIETDALLSHGASIAREYGCPPRNCRGRCRASPMARSSRALEPPAQSKAKMVNPPDKPYRRPWPNGAWRPTAA
ncbi:MAG: hypothetical protein EXR83_14980 [Gammaproteobacteria bacterium]|nr:hypothetical protein [Gammaproteobacteria bacterium]